MGWLSMQLSSMHPHKNPKSYLDAQFTYEQTYNAAGEQLNLQPGEPTPGGATTRGLRVVASSCLRNKVWYAAIAQIENGRAGKVFAAIVLVRWNPRAKDGYVFSYKDMDETATPFECECPERILRLLDATKDPSALVWRRRCIRNLMRTSRKLEDGMHIRLPSKMRFTDGHEGDEFFIRKRGRSTSLALTADGPPRYRIANLKRMDFDIIPQTRVHKTLFG
ncbi:MAG: hypothetical protein WBA51_14810 [Erythrobacter sp.]